MLSVKPNIFISQLGESINLVSKISIENGGLGPAIIKNLDFVKFKNESEIMQCHSLRDLIEGIHPETIGLIDQNLTNEKLIRDVPFKVGELLTISEVFATEKEYIQQLKEKVNEMQIRITYESVYGESVTYYYELKA